jgi:hypothetical protein
MREQLEMAARDYDEMADRAEKASSKTTPAWKDPIEVQ